MIQILKKLAWASKKTTTSFEILFLKTTTTYVEPVIFRFHWKPKLSCSLRQNFLLAHTFENNSPGIRIDEKSHITIKKHNLVLKWLKTGKNRPFLDVKRNFFKCKTEIKTESHWVYRCLLSFFFLFLFWCIISICQFVVLERTCNNIN